MSWFQMLLTLIIPIYVNLHKIGSGFSQSKCKLYSNSSWVSLQEIHYLSIKYLSESKLSNLVISDYKNTEEGLASFRTRKFVGYLLVER